MSGIYIHVPFCRKKCSYCDFHFSTTFEGYRTAMVERMLGELKQRIASWTHPIETLYFGGGSPGLLTPTELEAFFRIIYPYLPKTEKHEITLEANPEDLTEQNLLAWKDLGINRLSVGVQSLQDHLLQWMNRNHTAKDALLGLERLSKHNFSLSIDLIFGVPNQGVEDLEPLLALVQQQAINHISAYGLTKEPKTLLDHWLKKGTYKFLEDEEQVAHYQYVRNRLMAFGFEQYEVSNYARHQAYSIHNSNYWKRVPYLGIGPSAHSFDGHARGYNPPSNPNYVKTLAAGKLPFVLEKLEKEELINEEILTSLRTSWGLNTASLADRYHLDLFQIKGASITKLTALELIHAEGKTLTLTRKGKLLADSIAAEIFLDSHDLP